MKSSGEHRRGRSMGSAPPAIIRSGEKDEDLALFHEMKRREKHNFLHPSPDDLDATLSSKFGGMGAPTKKPGTDLLTSESDKNDYDWLLTPPGTPLFPSLDLEAAALAVLSPALSNGSYSSASSATKSLKSSTYSPAESVKGVRGNPSPRRQTSTGSTTPNGISRSRSSPSTAPILTRPSTPTSTGGTRPSTPTSKSSTPSVRSSTPNLKLTISHSSKSYSNATTPTGTRPSTPTPRSSTPTARPSTPGGRSSTPTSKPSTPTMRRSLSGGRTGITSPSPTTNRGGPSPKRSTSASRGNSPSAKRIASVITSIAGMSSEVPPNLRTTMPERSTSNGKGGHSNGSSYNNVEDSASSRRRPRSPSVARSFSSSSSQEQRTSSQTSRGSVISSYDDGLEVNRPSSYGSGRNSSAGKWHAAAHEELLSGKANAYAKRVAKSSSSRETSGYGVAPSKKSSDLVKRPVDAYQNSPTSAYRHLHSNSPVSPFYSTRTNSLLLRAGVAMNSSMTTSSNASSEHGTTVAADTEGSERDEDDLLSWDSYGRRASMSPRLQQADILVLDKDDEKTVPWQDSLFERANSHGPSSSHSQGSQSTLDAEVTGFYETDGIASLEMLEQLGLMGENYQLKKSSSFKGRSSEKRASSTEDIKIPNLNDYGLSRISPAKVYQEDQGSPARHLVQHLEKQEIPEHRTRSRDFDSKIPAHLVFQENLGSPARHLATLEKQQEIPDRPRKSRDFESKTSPHRRFSLEGQGSPSRRLPHLEKQDSLERPRRSRDFESKTSPHRRLSLEGQGSPLRLAQLEKQDSLERARRSRDFETQLMRRSGEKALGVVEPQVPSSEIRAACLFVRDFKVGLSPPHNQDVPGHAQDYSPGVKRQGIEETDNPPGVKRLGIEEMEMKLRNELSHYWDNSVETVKQRMIGPNGDTERGLNDSPIHVSRPKKNVGSPKSSARLSLDFPLTVYQVKGNDSLATPEMSKHVVIDSRKPDLTMLEDVELDHSILMNGTPTSVVIDESSVHDAVMIESEIESLPPKEVDLDSPIPPEGSGPNAMDCSNFDRHQAVIQDGTPSALVDDSSVHDGEMMESDTEPPPPKEVDLESPVHAKKNSPGVKKQATEEMDNPPRGKRLGIEEMEMKLRNELSHDWVNSVETVEQRMMGPNGDTGKGLSDSSILVSRPQKNVESPKSAARLGLEFPCTVYQAKINDSLVTPEMSKHVAIDSRKPDLTILKDVELDHSISMSGTPTSVLIEDLSVHDGVLVESEIESLPPKDVNLDSPIPPEGSGPNAMDYSKFDRQRAAIRDGTPASVLVDDSSVHDGVMIESEIESPPPEEVDLDSPVHPDGDRLNAMDYSKFDRQSAAIRDGTLTSVFVDSSSVHDGVMIESDTESPPSKEGNLDSAGHAENNSSGGERQPTQEMDSPFGVNRFGIEEMGMKLRNELSYDWDNSVGTVEQRMMGPNGDTERRFSDSAFLVSPPKKNVGSPKSSARLSLEFPFTVYQAKIDDLLATSEMSKHVAIDSRKPDLTTLKDVELDHSILMNGTPTSVVIDDLSVHDGVMIESEIESPPPKEVDLDSPKLPESSGPYVMDYSKFDRQRAAIRDALQFTSQLLGIQSDLSDDGVYAMDEDITEMHVPEDGTTASVSEEGSVVLDESLDGEHVHIMERQQISPMDVDEVSITLPENHRGDALGEIHEKFLQAEIEQGAADEEEVDVLQSWEEDAASEGLCKIRYSGAGNSIGEVRIPLPENHRGNALGGIHEKFLDAGIEEEAAHEEVDVLQSSEEDAANEGLYKIRYSGAGNLHKKLTEFDARCVENQQLSYASADANNCHPKSVHFDEKHPEVLDPSPNSEDINEVQPPKPEFRSASTLCAALEEQIAGLIQKIDSAIEESSQPFSASPQESLLLKDKRSILETEQDECTGSMRSSQEEDLIDMLWAEDGETSCSEESRDQDFLNSKDCSQWEMNGAVRSCRLSDRGLPVSLLGQSTDGYDAVVRASRSDLGVEKRMLEGPSKKSAVLPVDQLDDVVLMHSQELMKSPVKSPVKSPLKIPLKSQMKSPFLWSKELNAHDSLPEAHFHLDAPPKPDKSSGEAGLANSDGELRTGPFGREYGRESLAESSNCYHVEEMNTDAELLSLRKGTEQSGVDLDRLENPRAVLVSPKAEAGQVGTEVSLPKETLVADATSSEEITQEAGESSEAAERALPPEDMALEDGAREVDMSNIMSNGNSLTLETKDQDIQEQAHNRDRDESPILLTLARSELTSKVVNDAPNEEWLHRKHMLPEEASNRPVPSSGHVIEDPAVVELNEPECFKEPEVEMMEGSPSSTLTSELVDPKLEKEETGANIDPVLSNVDLGCVEMSEEVDVHPLQLSSQNEVSPADTILSPCKVPEMIGRETLRSVISPVNQKDDVMPVKVSRAKCGCTIM